MVRVPLYKYRRFVRPQSASTRNTVFDVEGVSAKLTLLHNIFEKRMVRMYANEPGCYDEFGSFIVLKSGTNSEGDRYVKTGYLAAFPNDNTYYYLNSDGSYYVNNPDGSEFVRRKDGTEWYYHEPQLLAPVPQGETVNMDLDGMVKIEVKEEEDDFVLL